MRIARISPSPKAYPPSSHGGTERVVSFLTEALVEMGHDVTLFASGDSQDRRGAGAGLRARPAS